MRRQAINGGEAAWAGPSTRLDPFALPVRFQAPLPGTAPEAPAAVYLDRDRVLVHRHAPQSVPMVLTLPIKSFRGVAARIRPVPGTDRIRVDLELMHRDPALSLPLASADRPEDIAADWQAWGRMLGRPLLLVEPDGRISEPFDRLGPMIIGEVRPRRRRSTFPSGRRSRFLMRRKTGGTPSARIEGREIIART